MDAFRKVRSGERLEIAASAWNKIINEVVTRPAFGGSQEPSPAINFLVRCRNDSTGTVSRWGVLEINGLIETPQNDSTFQIAQFEQYPGVIGVTPSGDAGSRFVVAVDPIKPGEIGIAAIDGIVQCRLNVKDNNHTYATPWRGHTDQLQSSFHGDARIIWKYSGVSGNDAAYKNALIRLGDRSDKAVKIGRITGTWTKGGTAVVWETYGNGTAVSGPSGPVSISAVNRFATVNASGSAAKWVAITNIDGNYHLIAAECS